MFDGLLKKIGELFATDYKLSSIGGEHFHETQLKEIQENWRKGGLID